MTVSSTRPAPHVRCITIERPERRNAVDAATAAALVEAFRAAGGVGGFVLFPPDGKEGHGPFTQDPPVWRPAASRFLRANGYPELTPRDEAAK